ncbi:hypothetical protein SAMN04487906_2490 [Zhouia amylolytica]|uniref:Import component protein n=1 Tax=Zhouia amylolytica TaxID=376730 RepID=A0A1I6UIJ0_9FLAO|nr:hypothetical protein [Zhouia amylolytica]SFT01097.1 hypothetical protein SAMN04487906_2490 [Zhouia amylolytica]
MNNSIVKEGKTTAIIGYLTIAGALIAYSMNMESKNEFARFHIRQAFGIHLLYISIAIILGFFENIYAYYGFWVFSLVLWVYGFSGALKGRKTIVPLVGELFQKWFKFIQ